MITTSLTRDYKETFKSSELKLVEDRVGNNYTSYEVGIDDQYTLFAFSNDCSEEVIDWILQRKYKVWPLIDVYEDIALFNSLDELKAMCNERFFELFDEPMEEL